MADLAALPPADCWNRYPTAGDAAVLLFSRPGSDAGWLPTAGLNILVTRLLDAIAADNESRRPRLRALLPNIAVAITGPDYPRWDDLTAQNRSRLLLMAASHD